MDDKESEHMNPHDESMIEQSEEARQLSKPEKPRGKCTGCAFDYQLGTARTGEHKGQLVIRKHNSRIGPGLCSGASAPPEGAGIDNPMASVDLGHSDAIGPVPGDVVGVALGGIPVVATPRDADGNLTGEPVFVGTMRIDPWTAPVPAMDVENGEGEPDTRRGPWVRAAFDSECDGTCGGSILEGDEIRADGEGGWLCRDCGADDPIRVETRVPLPVMSPVSISEVHAENPPRVVQSGPYAGAVVTVTAPLPFTAPAPASDIPESTTTVSGQPEPDRDRWGRYLIMGTAHTRATTFAKLGANTKAIGLWNERNVIRGLTLRSDLLMLANGLEVKRDRNDLNSIAAQAKDAAGSKVAANIGTAYHAFTERLDAGLITLGDVPPQYRLRCIQYLAAVKNVGLTTRREWIERTTAVRADQIGAPLPVAGTLDRIFQLPDGSLVIGDLKTGSDLSYGEMEIEVQLALYAHGVNTHGLFDWNTKQWERMPAPGGLVRTDIALVVHLPADGDGCTLYVADIERGWRDAQRLGPLQSSLKEKKRFRTLMAADLAPRPSLPVGPPTSPDLYPGNHWSAHPQTGPASCELPAQPSPDEAHANDQWEHAKYLFSTAPDQATIAQLYQFALDSGKFHTDQLAVLVGLGKDRLNALARG